MHGDRTYITMFVLAIGGTGCAAIANDTATDPTSQLSEPVFRCSVEPVLVRQCSYAACHGNAGTALRVYSIGKLRATPPASLDDQTADMTDAEHHANFTSATGFRVGADNPDDNFLLRKPLPAALGGYEHKGGAIFTATGDADYLAIHAWLAGTGKCP